MVVVTISWTFSDSSALPLPTAIRALFCVVRVSLWSLWGIIKTKCCPNWRHLDKLLPQIFGYLNVLVFCSCNKILKIINLNHEMFILLHNFGFLSMSSYLSHCFGPVMAQYITAGEPSMGSFHGIKKWKREKEWKEGPWSQ